MVIQEPYVLDLILVTVQTAHEWRHLHWLLFPSQVS